MKAALRIFLLSAAALPVFSQTSTVTIGAGGNIPVGTSLASSVFTDSGTILGEYEFRALPNLALDFGVENAFPTYTFYGGDGHILSARARSTFLPFGARGILPLRDHRVELYAGAGGAYVWHGLGGLPTYYGEGLNQWLWQVNAGARVALTHSHRYWAGATTRYYRDGLGSNKQQYLSCSGEFSFRFGR